MGFTALRGALAGIIGTAWMTFWMLAAMQLGLAGDAAPQEITANAARKAGTEPAESDPAAFHATWFAAHFAFGALGGALYALARPFLPRRSEAAGLTWAGGIWLTSYLGWLPSLGLYPAPDDDTAARQAMMITAHAVYGIALAETVDHL